MPSTGADYLASKVMAANVLTVPVVYGAFSARGHFRQDTDPVEDGMGGQTLSENRSVLVRTNALGTITRGSSITVDGLSYTVRDSFREGDGTLTRVLLVRVG